MPVSKQEKRDQLLDLALKILNDNGIKKTTLDDIAEAAGIATPSLYYYFRNKNEMLKGTISKVFTEATVRLESNIASCSSPEDKLRTIPKSLGSIVHDAKFIASVDFKVKSELVVLAQDLILSFQDTLTGNISAILQEGCDKGLFKVQDHEAASEVLALSIWNYFEKDIATPEFEAFESRINTLLTLIIEGLNKR